MQFICHRINRITELKDIPTEYGVELDLRDNLSGEIYISHDPFTKGDLFEDYLKEYHCKTMILNIKSERIEWRVLELLNKYRINSYFFLDSSFPMIYQLVTSGERNIAIRISEYESMDNAERMKGKVNWIWVDCFSNIPIEMKEADKLRELGYKLCLVSPELQNRPECIEEYAKKVSELKFDAICTKKNEIFKWKKLLNIK